MTGEEQVEWERGYRDGAIPRRPEEGSSQAYMQGYWAALRGPEEPKRPSFMERVAEYKRQKYAGYSLLPPDRRTKP